MSTWLLILLSVWNLYKQKALYRVVFTSVVTVLSA